MRTTFNILFLSVLSNLAFGFNKAPGQFDLISPSGRVAQTVINFSWSASEDPDGDEITYAIVLVWTTSDSKLHQIAIENIPTTSYSLDLENYPELWGMEVNWRVAAFDPSGLYGLARQQFTISTIWITGVNDDFAGISIYPNPVSQTFYIDVKDPSIKSIAIFDTRGVQTYSHKVEQSEVTIDVSSFVSGVYVVNLISSNEIRKMKFVKM